jgi:glycerophosphodiester phosphodiesterase
LFLFCFFFFFFSFFFFFLFKDVVASGFVLVFGDGVRSRRFETVALTHGDELVAEVRVMVTFAVEWKGSWNGPAHSWPSGKTIMIGHRGFGSTSERFGVLENTMLAFETAFHKGLRWAEFDVQLTSDLVPVLFHDDRVPVVAGNNANLMVPVSEFDSKQIEALSSTVSNRPKMSARKRSCSAIQVPGDGLPLTILDSFPTLSRVLEDSPVGMNFNVELKFTELKLGGEGLIVNRGMLVDIVLSVVAKSAGSRGIVFSSFDPDLCFIAKLKQKQYPVFFLTEGVKCVEDDPRQNSIEAAIDWAVMCGLDGIVADIASFVDRPNVVEVVHSHGLKFVSYGKLNNNADIVEKQRAWKMDGVITDTWRVVKE